MDIGTCTLSFDIHLPQDAAFLDFPANEMDLERAIATLLLPFWHHVGFEVQFMTLKQRIFLCV